MLSKRGKPTTWDQAVVRWLTSSRTARGGGETHHEKTEETQQPKPLRRARVEDMQIDVPQAWTTVTSFPTRCEHSLSRNLLLDSEWDSHSAELVQDRLRPRNGLSLPCHWTTPDYGTRKCRKTWGEWRICAWGYAHFPRSKQVDFEIGPRAQIILRGLGWGLMKASSNTCMCAPRN